MPVPRTSHTLTKLLAGWLWLMAAVVVSLGFIAALTAAFHAIGPGLRYTMSTRYDVPAWAWLVPFTAATVAYIFTSAAMVGSNHPWRWIGGIILLFMITTGFADALQLEQTNRVLNAVMTGHYGLAAIVGDLKMGEQIYSVARWLSAAALWAGIGTVLLTIALYRRTES